MSNLACTSHESALHLGAAQYLPQQTTRLLVTKKLVHVTQIAFQITLDVAKLSLELSLFSLKLVQAKSVVLATNC